MSLVDDQVRRLDALLDKFQISTSSQQSSLLELNAEGSPIASHAIQKESARSIKLKELIRSLSTTSSSRPLARRWRLKILLEQLVDSHASISSSDQDSSSDTDLEWLAASKAAVQTYGLILNTFLEQTIPLSDGIWYWDDILGSYANTALYTLQMWPLRAWNQVKEVYADAKQKYRSNVSIRESSTQATQTLRDSWSEFYGLVQQTIDERSLLHARAKILSPFAISRTEARRKQAGLRRLRELGGTAIGLVMDEGFTFTTYDEDDKNKGISTPELAKDEWRATVSRSVSLLEHVLRDVTVFEHGVADFEDSVFANVEGDAEIVTTGDTAATAATNPKVLQGRLLRILNDRLPEQEQNSMSLTQEYGRPTKLIRYWIPGVILLLSGSTILRLISRRRAEIRQWIQEAGQTAIDFWSNWVVEPVKRLIGTIRHDEESELAIMSKDSLKADQASLERMVVDFASDHPNETGAHYTETEMADIRAKVKEGDLTPVLRAYERDLRKPFMGTVRGDLIRALLIQIQKTKVDVEVAIGGIDSMLKSQELLFGVVSIAPGVVISYYLFQWLRGVFGSRRGLEQNRRQGETVRILR